MASYQEFMNRPEGRPSGIEVHQGSGFDEIVISPNGFLRPVKYVFSSFGAIACSAISGAIAWPRGSLDFSQKTMDGAAPGIVVHVIPGLIALLGIIYAIAMLWRLKNWLTKNIVRVEAGTRNFSLRRKAPWGESQPMEFAKGTAYPKLVAVETMESGRHGRRRRGIFHMPDYKLLISNVSPKERSGLPPSGEEVKRFVVSELEPEARKWMYQLIQAIQDRDTEVPVATTAKEVLEEVQVSYKDIFAKAMELKRAKEARGEKPKLFEFASSDAEVEREYLSLLNSGKSGKKPPESPESRDSAGGASEMDRQDRRDDGWSKM